MTWAHMLTLVHVIQVSDRLEAAVNQALDDGLRTGDIFKDGYHGTRKVKCSELSDHLLKTIGA